MSKKLKQIKWQIGCNYSYERMTGNNKNDFRSANEKIGLSGSKPPTGYTWHHMEDGKNMLLVERQIHDCSIGGFPHTGGASIIRNQN